MIRRRHLVAVAGGILLVACDPSAEFGPPETLSQGQIAANAVVGTTISAVRVTVRDEDGKAVKRATVSWSAAGGGTASPAESATDDEGTATTAWTLGTIAGTQTLRASIEDLETTFTVTAAPGPLALVAVEHGGRVLHAVGDTLHVRLTAEDEYGNAIANPGATWSSADPAIASVADGIVTALDEGTARIVARAGSLADTAEVEVDQIVAAIGLTPAKPRVLVKAEMLQLTAVPVDSNGAAVDTAITPVWSTSNGGVASVDNSGLVNAVELGEAVVTAAAGPYAGTASLKVKAGPRPTIAGITPDVATPGGTLTISGSGFSDTPALNTVTFGGSAGTVVAAAPSELTVQLDATSLPCAPTADVEVVVVVDELEAFADHPLAAATQVALAVGESATLTGAGARCSEIPTQGQYVVSVFNSTNTHQATTAFRLRGTASSTFAAAPDEPVSAAMAGVTRRTLSVPARTARVHPRPEELAHARVLAMNLDLLERLGRPQRSAGGMSSLRVAAVPTVGDILPLRIPDLDGNACSQFKVVTARVAAVGDYGVVLEDTLSPLAGDIDAHWQAVSQEYDALMHDVLLDYFGDPLILDDQLDQNDRMFMLFSKQVNDFETGVAGFVFSGDFYPRSQGCASSNEAEIFYGIVPTILSDPETPYAAGTVKAWMRTMRSTVIHEVKHILSFASRIHAAPVGQNPSWEVRWLEESTARLAEEFYARAQYGYAQRANTQYEQSIYCEVRPTGWDECSEGSPYVMAKHYFAILDYYNAVEYLTPIGEANDDDYTFYGSGWLFVRWAIDQSAGLEADFIKALVAEPSLSGISNIAARTGRSYPQMLADFSLALAVDDRDGFTPVRPELTFPSWDTRDVFNDLYEDFNDQIPTLDEPFPLATRTVSAGNFQVNVQQVRGGTAALFELGGTFSGSQLLELQSGSGGTPPSTLGVAIVRVQ